METISYLHPFTLLNCLLFLVITINGDRPDSWVGCGEPGTPSNGIKYIKGQLQNEWTYKCNKGFVLVGNPMRSCLPNGTWSPHPIPKCVSNLAYNKVAEHAPFARSEGTLSVDGDTATCSNQKKNYYGYIDMKTSASFDTVTIIVKEYESKAAYVNISVTNDTKVTRPDFKNRSALRPLMCFDGTVKRTKSLICQQKEVAQYVVIYSNVSAYICDVAVYDSNEVMSCGKPDQPLHGRINKSDASFLEYECDVGYTVQLSSVRHCYKGNWSPNLPHCINSTPTDLKTDFWFTGITGIGVGATGAFLIALIGCFFVRRYYRSKNGNNNDSDVYSEPGYTSYDQRSANGSVSVHLYSTVNDLDCSSISGNEQAALTRNHVVNRDAATCAIYDNVGAQFISDRADSFGSQTLPIYDNAISYALSPDSKDSGIYTG